MNIISLIATVVTFVFAAAVFTRWRHRGKEHLLLWGIGLVLYGLGTLSEVLLSISFNPWMLKIWYLAGAMLTAAWLGQGTVYLLVRKRGVADKFMIGLGLASALAVLLVFAAPIDQAGAAAYDAARPVSEQYQDILVRSGSITLLTILLNVYGTITLVGGAIYSAYLFRRKRVLVNRMYGNILITAGALMPALAGTFVKMGLVDWLYMSELVGVVLMYSGFMLATAHKTAHPPQPSTAASS